MKLALGTVQFGLDYGVTNTQGIVPRNEVKKILNAANSSGITMLDTAAAYGSSELLLGELAKDRFEIISKIPPLRTVSNSIRQCLTLTLQRLSVNNLHCLMFHDEKDIYDNQNHIELLKLKEIGLTSKIGCSLYSLEALEFILNKSKEVDIIQVPANCLDHRFVKSGLLSKAKERGIEIHCRSLFLQGLLLDRESLPDSLKEFSREINCFFEYAEYNKLKPIELALTYLVQNELIDFGVIGCQSVEQLDEITSAYNKIKNLNLPIEQLASSSEVLLNPSLWS